MSMYLVESSHTNGQSISHACVHGVYEDPTEALCVEVEADSEEAAVEKGHEALWEIVSAAKPCSCHRAAEPGSRAWWNSVSITAKEVEA